MSIGGLLFALGRSDMAIHFNHTILSAHDSKASAIFLRSARTAAVISESIQIPPHL